MRVQRLKVESERGDYSVVAQAGAVSRLGKLLADEGLRRPRTVVSNTTVGPLWGRPAADSLGAPLIELADGEENKRWSTVQDLLGRWLDQGIHRGDSVAAVGGKTGVNLLQGKNLVGAFWPPRLVVIDVETLSTLPERELRSGMAEVIKTAWIGDHELLPMVTASRGGLSTEQWQELVMRCVAVKARVVNEDERETGKRAALNLGHTLGHALEAATGYTRFLHGEAIAWGLLAAAMLGRRHGLLSKEGEEVIGEAIAALGPLPSLADIDEEAIRSRIGRDKKRHDGGIGWVLPTEKGIALDQRVTVEEALEVLRELKESSIQRD